MKRVRSDHLAETPERWLNWPQYHQKPGCVCVSACIAATMGNPYRFQNAGRAVYGYIIPLVMTAPHFQTTSTTPQNIGGYFPWDPARFPGPGTWHLEADMAIANAASTATCQLRGTDVLRAVTTQQTGLSRVRSTEIAMPATAQNLWVQAFTSNASHAVTLGGAKLIFVPV